MNWRSHLGKETSMTHNESLCESYTYSFLSLTSSLCLAQCKKDWLPQTEALVTQPPPPHTPFLSVAVLRLFLSCCTIGLSSFPAFNLCLLALRLRPLGGAAWSEPTLGGRLLPSSLYRCSISPLWNACSSEISFMCLVRKLQGEIRQN